MQAREALLEGAKSGKLAEAGVSHATRKSDTAVWGVKGQDRLAVAIDINAVAHLKAWQVLGKSGAKVDDVGTQDQLAWHHGDHVERL